MLFSVENKKNNQLIDDNKNSQPIKLKLASMLHPTKSTIKKESNLMLPHWYAKERKISPFLGELFLFSVFPLSLLLFSFLFIYFCLWGGGT
jgi:hypothetical protein